MGDQQTCLRVCGILLDAENLHATAVFGLTVVLCHGKPAIIRYRICCIPVCCKILLKSKENIQTQSAFCCYQRRKIFLHALSSETLSGYDDSRRGMKVTWTRYNVAPVRCLSLLNVGSRPVSHWNNESYTCWEWRHSQWLREGQLHEETRDAAIKWRRVVYIDTAK